ncbi:hypothetical protein SSTU70S_02078 [Stutzerimonas stutzeri]
MFASIVRPDASVKQPGLLGGSIRHRPPDLH